MCVRVRACVTALSGIYSGPSWSQGNILTVVTADITDHRNFCHAAQIIVKYLCARDND